MNLQWLKIWEGVKEFLSFPAAKQVIAIFIGIIFVVGLMYWDQGRDLKAANRKNRECDREIIQLTKEYTDTIKLINERHYQEIRATDLAHIREKNETISKLQEKEAAMDEALYQVRRVIPAQQRRAKANIQKVNSKFNKIVKDATE